MAKPKILHIATYKNGGAGNAAMRLHKGLLQNGYQSKFLFLEKGRVTETEFQYKKRIELFQLALRILKRLGLPLNLEQKNQYSIRKYKSKVEIFSFANNSHTKLQEHQLVKECDIVHLHWIANFVDFATFFPNLKKPIVWTLHDMNAFQGGFHYKGDEERWGTQFQSYNDRQIKIKKNTLDQVPVDKLTIVTPSRWLFHLSKASDLLGKFPHYCIPYGLDTETFTPKTKINLKSDGKIKVLFVAESLYNHRKGFDIVLEILRDKNVTEKYHFTAVGHEKKGSQTPSVSYTGVISSEKEMSELYADSDIFLLPSREDNLPNTMLESLCCGTPVVGFALGGLLETITNGVNGFLANEVTSQSLKEALQTCTENLPFFDRQKIAADAKMKYSSNVQVKAFSELYQQCFTNFVVKARVNS